MIIQTIDNASQLRDEFEKSGRKSQFTYQAIDLLFDYLSDMGADYV